MSETFAMLRGLIEERKEEAGEVGASRSMEESEMKINGVLLAASLLRFDTVLDPASTQRKAGGMKAVSLLTLVVFKGQVVRLVDELEKLEKSAVSAEVVRGMFEIAKFCSALTPPALLPLSTPLTIQSNAYRPPRTSPPTSPMISCCPARPSRATPRRRC